MNRIMKRLWRHTITRTTIILVSMAVFLLCGALFYNNEMIQNRAYYIRHYEEQQQSLTDQLAGRVEEQIKDGVEGTSLFNYMEQNSVNSGNRWSFLIRKDRILFVKNTNELLRIQKNGIVTGEQLIEHFQLQNAILTTAEFTYEDATYQLGISSDRDFVLLDGKVNKHTTYILMALAVLSGVFYAVCISLTLYLNTKDSKIRHLEKDLQAKNEKLSELANERLIQTEQSRRDMSSISIQENSLLDALMKRTATPALFPVGLMDCYIPEVLEPELDAHRSHAIIRMKETLDPCHVFVEVNDHEFVILMYRTSEEICIKFKHILQDILTQEVGELTKDCRMHLICVDYETSTQISMSQLLYRLRQKLKES